MAKLSKKFRSRFLEPSPPQRPDDRYEASPHEDLREAAHEGKKRSGERVRTAIRDVMAGSQLAPAGEAAWEHCKHDSLVSISELKTELERLKRAIENGETATLEVTKRNSALVLTIHRDRVTAVQSMVEKAEAAALPRLDKNSCEIDLDDVDRRMAENDIATGASPESDPSLPGLRSPAIRRRGHRNWELAEDCSYVSSHGHTVVARAGFETDLASIPRPFWLFIAPDELGVVAPTIHDLIYRSGGKVALPDGEAVPRDKTFTRQEADDIFREAMKNHRVDYWKREVAYHVVAVFGGSAWRTADGPGSSSADPRLP